MQLSPTGKKEFVLQDKMDHIYMISGVYEKDDKLYLGSLEMNQGTVLDLREACLAMQKINLENHNSFCQRFL